MDLLLLTSHSIERSLGLEKPKHLSRAWQISLQMQFQPRRPWTRVTGVGEESSSRIDLSAKRGGGVASAAGDEPPRAAVQASGVSFLSMMKSAQAKFRAEVPWLAADSSSHHGFSKASGGNSNRSSVHGSSIHSFRGSVRGGAGAAAGGSVRSGAGSFHNPSLRGATAALPDAQGGGGGGGGGGMIQTGKVCSSSVDFTMAVDAADSSAAGEIRPWPPSNYLTKPDPRHPHHGQHTNGGSSRLALAGGPSGPLQQQPVMTASRMAALSGTVSAPPPAVGIQQPQAALSGDSGGGTKGNSAAATDASPPGGGATRGRQLSRGPAWRELLTGSRGGRVQPMEEEGVKVISRAESAAAFSVPTQTVAAQRSLSSPFPPNDPAGNLNFARSRFQRLPTVAPV